MAETNIPALTAGELTWDVASLFPVQGHWSSVDYLNLTDGRSQLVELVDGRLEVLEMPTTSHQQIVFFLLRGLAQLIESRSLGTALMAPLRVQLRTGLFCEPDIVYASNEHLDFVREDYWTGADLVIEVVSPNPKSRRRDLVEKKREYAEAGIVEYWIVDPLTETISVLSLTGNDYVEAGLFGIDQKVKSVLLPEFSVNVKEVFKP